MSKQVAPQVSVLLSTYNGEKYLAEQINSILEQKGARVQLYIRDDGSTDRTRAILESFEQINQVHLSFQSNVGWKRSFTELLQTTPDEPNTYYAFADQDDIWQPDKLIQAVNQLMPYASQPTVYHSNVAIVDGNMHFIQNRFDEAFMPNQQLPQAYFDGLGVGATMVFNEKMLRLIQQYVPQQATNHDALVMALGNMLGKVIYDPTAHILYRRHDGTATGFGAGTNAAKPSLLDRYRKYQRGPKQQFSIRAQELLAGYQDQLSADEVRLLTKVADYRHSLADRLYLLFSPNIKASGMRKTLQIKYRAFMGTL
jgi:rhamnosyltransferase